MRVKIANALGSEILKVAALEHVARATIDTRTPTGAPDPHDH